MKLGTSMIMAYSSRKNRLLASKFTLHFESNQSVVQQKMQIIKNETHHANKTGNVDNYGTIIEEESLADLLPMN
jgi:hypothetical protein